MIERDWYVLGDWRLTDDGRCVACGTRVPGRFDGPPGRLGRAPGAGAASADTRWPGADVAGAPARGRGRPLLPRRPGRARAAVDRLLDPPSSRPTAPRATPPKAFIVPHAGYVYSGPIAATAYARLAPRAARGRPVVLLPGRRTACRSAGSRCRASTRSPRPLGRGRRRRRRAAHVRWRCAGVVVDDAAHAREHSLEVHLPFLQRVARRGRSRCCRSSSGRRGRRSLAAVLDAAVGRARDARRGEHRPQPLPRPRAPRRASTRRTAAAIVDAATPTASAPQRRVRRVRRCSGLLVAARAPRPDAVGCSTCAPRPTPPARPTGSSATARSRCDGAGSCSCSPTTTAPCCWRLADAPPCGRARAASRSASSRCTPSAALAPSARRFVTLERGERLLGLHRHDRGRCARCTRT